LRYPFGGSIVTPKSSLLKHMSYPNPADLWQLNPDEFNKWRRENDLKHLFECFQKRLPHYDEWLKSFGIDTKYILESDKPGQFFYGEYDVYCVKTIKKEYNNYDFYRVHNEKHNQDLLVSLKKPEEGEKIEYVKFTPYFAWVKNVKGERAPINNPFGGGFDTFRYTSGIAPQVPEACQWVIAPGMQVLKLGGTQIESWLSLYGRNLDFANLDFLEIKGKGSWSTGLEIFYSHCDYLKLDDVEANFTEFYECHFRKLKVENSRLFGIAFTKCDLFQSYFENTSISGLLIVHSAVSGLSFNRVETDEIYYYPPKKHYYESLGITYEVISKNFKQLRVLYQSNGMRQESSESFYKERLYEMKSKLPHFQFFKAIPYLWKYGWKYVWKELRKSVVSLTKFITDFISYVIWGFGERPLRIIATSLVVILIFSLFYFNSSIQDATGNYINSLYFSVVTFTTLGFGDITPLKSDGSFYKLLVASEALMGAFCMGLVVAGFANKSRY
jgi:hypothetical protein